MLADTQLFALWLVFTTVPYWLIPADLCAWRVRWLIAASVGLIFAIAPFALVYIACMWLICVVVCQLPHAQRPTWFLPVALLLVCAPLLSQRLWFYDASLIHTLGITFATLRAAALVFDNHTSKRQWPARQMGLTLLFVPLYTVGPIEAAATFKDERFAVSPEWWAMLRALSRCCLGLFKTVFIAEHLINGAIQTHITGESLNVASITPLNAWLLVFLSFSYTYINFSGFVDLAIGISRLFGLTVMENFNFPVFALSLQDFWRRWHISLGQWISRYLYFPVVALIRRSWAPYAGVFIAFSLIGWWHASTANYIAWGVLHGAGMCLVLLWQRTLAARDKKTYEQLKRNPLYISVCWLVTISYVAWVQTFANLASFAEGIQLSLKLVGL